MRTPVVLIAGAGPTGLVLALWLTRFGVRVRIVDKAPEPGTTSRALVVHARTLELYQQMGLAAAIVERAITFDAINFWTAGKRRAHMEFGAIGTGLSPFPYILIFPQDEHEKLLIERLAAAGVRVERPVELVGIEQRADCVVAQLRRADGTRETFEADYLAGCDGARSFVRQSLQTGFPGGTYGHLFYVADIEGSGPLMNRELHVALDDADFIALFPMKAAGRARLIGSVRAEAEREGERIGWEDVNKSALTRVPVKVERVNWFSTYHVHHRVASSFRDRRIFLLGDAAHIHSPVGGQGMNTGIGDAVNLAWKLAAVIGGRAGARILDSYAEERVPFAQRLVHTTDRAFEFATSRGAFANAMRLHVAPRFLAAAFRMTLVRRYAFRTISQILVRYRASALNEGRAGDVNGGDRLPWTGDNFDPLSSMSWRAQVFGDATEAVRSVCDTRGIPVDVFAWSDRAKRAGLERDALYLVRPDGYVGLAAPASSAAEILPRYLDERGIRLAS